MAGYLITPVLSLAINLLPPIIASAQALSSSSSNSNNSENERARFAEEDLQRLMRTLERIKATLYDAEEREIRDCSVKLWLKELKKVASDAEDVLGEYQNQVKSDQIQARKDSEASSSHKGQQIECIVPIPDDIVDRLNKIRSRFDEIAKDRDALQLRESGIGFYNEIQKLNKQNSQIVVLAKKIILLLVINVVVIISILIVIMCK